jgi:hypothetical protein
MSTALWSATTVTGEMTWCFGELGETLGDRRGSRPALTGDHLRCEVADRLDRKHQVEGDEIDRIAIAGQGLRTCAMVRAQATHTIVELGNLASYDFRRDHRAIPSRKTVLAHPYDERILHASERRQVGLEVRQRARQELAICAGRLVDFNPS